MLGRLVRPVQTPVTGVSCADADAYYGRTLGMISDELVLPKAIKPGKYVLSWCAP